MDPRALCDARQVPDHLLAPIVVDVHSLLFPKLRLSAIGNGPISWTGKTPSRGRQCKQTNGNVERPILNLLCDTTYLASYSGEMGQFLLWGRYPQLVFI